MQLDVHAVANYKKTQLESTKSLTSETGTPLMRTACPARTTLLFHLNTLYSLQARAWQKYDEQYAMFEDDHVKTAAPIPSNPQFLLVHLIQQLKDKSAEMMLQPEHHSSM